MPKRRSVIRVRIPLDLHAVARSGSVFALATPMRLRDLLVLVVREAIGARAPYDKMQRSLRATLAGLSAGRFTVDVDGRSFRHADAVVVCEQSATVRFFIASETVRRPELAAPER